MTDHTKDRLEALALRAAPVGWALLAGCGAWVALLQLIGAMGWLR